MINLSLNYPVKYEGIIPIDNVDLFFLPKVIYWKYHLG